MKKIKLAKGGQAMILTILALGGTILGATTIAGLLMTYQIRQTTDIANSTKAIFAAEAGIEKGLYNYFRATPVPCPDTASLSNGATFTECTDADAGTIKSIGSAFNSRRAFLLNIQAATLTLP